MKWKELKTKTPSELSATLSQVQLELMKERAQVAVGTTPKSPRKIRSMRRTIARIYTLETSKLKENRGAKQKP